LSYDYYDDGLTIDIGNHVLLPNTPGQVIPIYASGGAEVQGLVLNVQIADGSPDVPGSGVDGPNIAGVDLTGADTVFGSVSNTGHNFIETRDQIWVVGIATSSGTVPADGLLGYLTIDTTGWFGGDGPWELKLADTFNGDTNFQSPNGQTVSTITNGSIRIDNLPTANLGGPYAVNEGASVRLDGSGSSDPDAGDAIVQYQWDLDGDGVYGETGDAAPQGDEIGVSPTFSAVGVDGPAAWEISLRVIDDHGGISDPQTVLITVNNVAPVLGPVEDVTIHRVHSLDLQNLPVTFSDTGMLDVHTATVDWGDGSAPDAGVVVEPCGTNAGEVLATHSYAVGGSYIVTVAVEDDDGGSDSVTFNMVVLDGQVLDRYVAYIHSAWDGNNPDANADDDSAIAPDKEALLPGQTATFANYTSYAKGLNCIMIDVANPAGTLTNADFVFLVGNSDDPTTWSAAPAPQSITTRSGAGVDGSDRVTIIWADDNSYTPDREPGAISKQWLQVTVLPTANTGLAEADVFYFGNAIGESGNSATETNVDTNDGIGARNHPHSLLDPAPIQDAYDYDRDQRVDTNDEILARNNSTSAFSRLGLIIVPPAADDATATGLDFQKPAMSALVTGDGSDDAEQHTVFADVITGLDHSAVHGGLPLSEGQEEAVGSHVFPSAELFDVVNDSAVVEVELAESEGQIASPAIDIGDHVLQPNMPDQVIPIYVSGGRRVQGIVFNAQLTDGYPNVPGSHVDGPNITGVDLVGPETVFGSVANTGHNLVETREQIWVVGTSTKNSRVTADGVLAYVAIDTTGWFDEDGPWELKLTGTFNGDTSFQSPSGRIVASVVNGSIEIKRWHNSEEPTDVNCDGVATPLDVLRVVNTLNVEGSVELSMIPAESLATLACIDTNNDGMLTPADALQVVNELNRSASSLSQSAGEGETRFPHNGSEPCDVNSDKAVLAWEGAFACDELETALCDIAEEVAVGWLE